MSPIFVFGTGRCGSTHVQRLITLATRCWVWGEHEGFLEPLLASIGRYETGQRLKRFVFNRTSRDQGQLIAEVAAGSDTLSWLNLLDAGEFRAEVVSLIDRMFRSHVPEGWSGWGFKEIRYGLDNNAPEILLDLFPESTGVFVFRDPKSTIESMVRTWSPKLMAGAANPDKLSNLYYSYATRWKKTINYFLDCETRAGNGIVYLSIEKLDRPVDEILAALGLKRARPTLATLATTNRGPKKMPDWARDRFDELFDEDASEYLDLFARARARSDAHFASHPSQRASCRSDFKADDGVPASVAAD